MMYPTNRMSRAALATMAVVAMLTLACAGTDEQDPPATAADGPSSSAPSAAPVADQENAEVSCELRFTMEGWSAIISKAEGRGTVTCDNGQSAPVNLEVTGGGLTAGKTEIDEGHGRFSEVSDIAEIFGSYAQAEAHAGAVEAASAQVLTKGEVSLAITAEGRGWSLGVSGAEFEITRADNN